MSNVSGGVQNQILDRPHLTHTKEPVSTTAVGSSPTIINIKLQDTPHTCRARNPSS